MFSPNLHPRSRTAFFSLLLTFVFAIPALAQVDIRGVLSSKAAPVPDSRARGFSSTATTTAPAPNSNSRGFSSTATATAPAPNNNSRGFSSTATKPPQPFRRLSVRLPVPFGDPHRRHRDAVAVPLFYPVYLYPNNGLAPQDQQAAPDAPASADDQALQDAYDRGAQDALAQQQNQARNAQRYSDSRDSRDDSFGQPANAKAAVVEPEPDNGPPTVFIFKDGRRIETKNFAIMGQTLFDFSAKPLRKIQLIDLDLAATTKVNDEMGNSVRLQ